MRGGIFVARSWWRKQQPPETRLGDERLEARHEVRQPEVQPLNVRAPRADDDVLARVGENALNELVVERMTALVDPERANDRPAEQRHIPHRVQNLVADELVG